MFRSSLDFKSNLVLQRPFVGFSIHINSWLFSRLALCLPIYISSMLTPVRQKKCQKRGKTRGLLYITICYSSYTQ